MDRRVHDEEKHIHFVTFSCYKRRKLLSSDRAKRIVIGHLGSRLRIQNGICTGFVIMPDHVHALVWFPETDQISRLMNKWKDQTSAEIKQFLMQHHSNYFSTFDPADPIWQRRYYGFNIWTRKKVEEKLNYMHLNPVRANLVERTTDWPWSSARWYQENRFAGVDISWPPGLETDDDFNV